MRSGHLASGPSAGRGLADARSLSSGLVSGLEACVQSTDPDTTATGAPLSGPAQALKERIAQDTRFKVMPSGFWSTGGRGGSFRELPEFGTLGGFKAACLLSESMPFHRFNDDLEKLNPRSNAEMTLRMAVPLSM
jgi:hypothetical protein